jgi:hypothetical protein
MGARRNIHPHRIASAATAALLRAPRLAGPKFVIEVQP